MAIRDVSKANKEAFSDGLNFLRYLHDSNESYNLPFMESCITAPNFQKILKLLPVLTSPIQLVNLVSSHELVNDIMDLVQLTFGEPQFKERIKIHERQTGSLRTERTLSTTLNETELWSELSQSDNKQDEESETTYWNVLLGEDSEASTDEEYND